VRLRRPNLRLAASYTSPIHHTPTLHLPSPLLPVPAPHPLKVAAVVHDGNQAALLFLCEELTLPHICVLRESIPHHSVSPISPLLPLLIRCAALPHKLKERALCRAFAPRRCGPKDSSSCRFDVALRVEISNVCGSILAVTPSSDTVPGRSGQSPVRPPAPVLTSGAYCPFVLSPRR
jgi:hypothetical protein